MSTPNTLIKHVIVIMNYYEDGNCFLAAWVMSKSALVIKHDRPKPKLQKRKVILPIPMFSKGLLISKRPFQNGAMPEKNYPFQGTLSTSFPHFFLAKHRRPHCKENERSLLSYFTL